MGPCVVSAVKSGAVSLIRSIVFLLSRINFDGRPVRSKQSKTHPAQCVSDGLRCEFESEESVLPTAYTRTHIHRQQQQVVVAFAFSIVVMADLLAAASHAGVKKVRPIAV